MPETKRILVVYYSYSGNTRTIGRAIAERLGADTEEIVDLRQKHGVMLFVVGGFKAFLKRLTDIEPTAHDPSQYDLVIVGSPVYASNIPSPVRTYLSQQGKSLKQAAYFVTAGDASNGQVADAMAELVGKPAKAKMIVRDQDVRREAYQTALDSFCAEIEA